MTFQPFSQYKCVAPPHQYISVDSKLLKYCHDLEALLSLERPITSFSAYFFATKLLPLGLNPSALSLTLTELILNKSIREYPSLPQVRMPEAVYFQQHLALSILKTTIIGIGFSQTFVVLQAYAPNVINEYLPSFLIFIRDFWTLLLLYYLTVRMNVASSIRNSNPLEKPHGP